MSAPFWGKAVVIGRSSGPPGRRSLTTVSANAGTEVSAKVAAPALPRNCRRPAAWERVREERLFRDHRHVSDRVRTCVGMYSSTKHELYQDLIRGDTTFRTDEQGSQSGRFVI